MLALGTLAVDMCTGRNRGYLGRGCVCPERVCECGRGPREGDTAARSTSSWHRVRISQE